jgi:hypothetical protein
MEDLIPADHPPTVASEDAAEPLVEVGLSAALSASRCNRMKARMRRFAPHSTPFTSSPPTCQYGSGNRAAISPMKPSMKL